MEISRAAARNEHQPLAACLPGAAGIRRPYVSSYTKRENCHVGQVAFLPLLEMAQMACNGSLKL